MRQMNRKLTIFTVLTLLLIATIYLSAPQRWPVYPMTRTLILEKDLVMRELAAAPPKIGNYGKLYVLSSDGHLYFKDDSGATTDLTIGGADLEKVKIDVGATSDYIGAANNDGVLRAGTSLSYADGGNFITLNAIQDIRTSAKPSFAGATLTAESNFLSYYGTMQTATGDGTTTVVWASGNYMYFSFGAMNETFTFTAPANKGKVTLILKQDGVGSAGCVVDSDSETSLSIDYNQYYQPNATDRYGMEEGVRHNWTNWKAVSYSPDANSPTPADPLFFDAANDDFHLKHGSPCRGKGTDVGLTHDYDGKAIQHAPEIGAFEYYADSLFFSAIMNTIINQIISAFCKGG